MARNGKGKEGFGKERLGKDGTWQGQNLTRKDPARKGFGK